MNVPCRPAKVHGARNLQAIDQDGLPINIEAWPEDVPLLNPALSSDEQSALDGVVSQVNRIHEAQAKCVARGMKRSTSFSEEESDSELSD